MVTTVGVVAVPFKIAAAIIAAIVSNGSRAVADSNPLWILTGKSQVDPNFITILRVFWGFRINPNIFPTLSLFSAAKHRKHDLQTDLQPSHDLQTNCHNRRSSQLCRCHRLPLFMFPLVLCSHCSSSVLFSFKFNVS